MEKHYAFLIANKVQANLVFAEQNDELAAQICKEQNYDKFIWLDDKPTPVHDSEYIKRTDTFVAPVAEPTEVVAPQPTEEPTE